jgi:Glycosyltransferase
LYKEGEEGRNLIHKGGKIWYVYGNCSKSKYERLFRNTSVMILQQAQKYHSLLIEGLHENQAEITCISGLPVNRRLSKKLFYKQETEQIDGITYLYSGFINLFIVRQIFLFFSSLIRTVRYLKKNNNTAVICDPLNIASSAGAILAAKLCKVITLGIITDLPEYISAERRASKSIRLKINHVIISKFDAYVFLTKGMNECLNPFHKPFLVLEGHVDQKLNEEHSLVEKKHLKNIILYAGSINKKYGIELLVNAFLLADLNNSVLHIYGDGDYVSDLLVICNRHPSVQYMGVKSNDYIVEQEKKAVLLVNPRPSGEEFTKYSFPSKNMEYMVSGTPVLTTKLEGMPDEYDEYVYIIKEETVEGFRDVLIEVLGKSKEELQEKGKRAKEFVLREKNNQIQARKILDLLRKIS